MAGAVITRDSAIRTLVVEEHKPWRKVDSTCSVPVVLRTCAVIFIRRNSRTTSFVSSSFSSSPRLRPPAGP